MMWKYLNSKNEFWNIFNWITQKNGNRLYISWLKVKNFMLFIMLHIKLKLGGKNYIYIYI